MDDWRGRIFDWLTDKEREARRQCRLDLDDYPFDVSKLGFDQGEQHAYELTLRALTSERKRV
jgi:hypothetical protein